MRDALTIENTARGLLVRFTRPEIRNPLSIAVIDQIHLVLDDAHTQPDIEALIFTGSGQSFASGADLREIAGISANAARGFARYGQELMDRIAALEIQTFAAVNGYCFGGALDLALACDYRFACQSAKFAHPGAGLGIITGWGGTQRLPRLIGRGNALEMFFTAEAVDARRALNLGLINGIADDPVAACLANIDAAVSS